MTAALAAVCCVAIVSASGLAGLVLWFRHREKKFEHQPVADLQGRVDVLERKHNHLHTTFELSKLKR